MSTQGSEKTQPATAAGTYTVAETAAILGIGETTAYTLAKSGPFRTVRIGSAIRISRISFDAWLNAPVDDPTLFV